jgi:hypothetical protein
MLDLTTFVAQREAAVAFFISYTPYDGTDFMYMRATSRGAPSERSDTGCAALRTSRDSGRDVSSLITGLHVAL